VIRPGICAGGDVMRAVIVAAIDQPHAVAVTLDANAKTVLLNFVQPFRTSRNLISVGWETELKRLKHEPKIGIWSQFCEFRFGTAFVTKHYRARGVDFEPSRKFRESTLGADVWTSPR
jgi:hypothetical protein